MTMFHISILGSNKDFFRDPWVMEYSSGEKRHGGSGSTMNMSCQYQIYDNDVRPHHTPCIQLCHEATSRTTTQNEMAFLKALGDYLQRCNLTRLQTNARNHKDLLQSFPKGKKGKTKHIRGRQYCSESLIAVKQSTQPKPKSGRSTDYPYLRWWEFRYLQLSTEIRLVKILKGTVQLDGGKTP